MPARYQSRLEAIQPVRSNQPQLFRSLASRLSAFSEQQENELDREMAKKAKEKGLIDAQGKTQITLRDGNTIADEAWNEGAVASHLAAIKLDIDDNLTRIEAESSRNPEAYTVKAKAYSNGLLEGVPDNVRPAVQNELAEIMLSSTQKITADLRTFERDQHASTTGTAIELYRTDGENRALSGDMVGATEAQFNAIRLTDSLENAGLLTPKAAEKQRENITRDVEDQAIYGEFARKMADGQGVDFINKFKKLKSLGNRDPEYRSKMEKKMVSMMKQSHVIEDDQRKQDDVERKARHRTGLKDAISQDLQGQLTTDKLVYMVDNDLISAKDAAKLEKSASMESVEFSSGESLNKYNADILAYTEMDIRTDPTLSRKDVDKLIGERRALEADKTNWRSTINGREGARRINDAFGKAKEPGAKVTKEDIQRSGMALTRYFNEVNALPLEEREIKAPLIADSIVSEINNEIAAKDLQKAREKLTRKPYQTVEDIEKSDLGDEEKKTQVKQLERLLNKIRRLERE